MEASTIPPLSVWPNRNYKPFGLGLYWGVEVAERRELGGATHSEGAGAAGEGQRSLARRAQGRRCRGQPEGGRGRDEHAATIPQALECENMLMGIFRSCTKHQLNSHLIMSGHKIGAVHVYLAHPRDLADHLARRRAFLPRGFWPRVFLSGPTKRAQGTRIGVMSHENNP